MVLRHMYISEAVDSKIPTTELFKVYEIKQQQSSVIKSIASPGQIKGFFL